MTINAKHSSLYVLILFFILGCNTQNNDSKTTNNDMTEYREFLQNTMRTQSEWVKVHAAEYLIWTDNTEGVKTEFLEQEKQFGLSSPYRIGIWRTLAQVSADEKEREMWIQKIENAFVDTLGSDRVHAVETLAKLKRSPLEKHPLITTAALESNNIPLAMYVFWSTAYTSDDSLRNSPEKLIGLIEKAGNDPKLKSTPGYALRHLALLNDTQLQRLTELALSEPADSPARIYLLSAVFVSNQKNGNPLDKKVYQALIEYSTSSAKGNRTELAAALAASGSEQDIPMLITMFKNEVPLETEVDNIDAAAAAAYAILMIHKRGSNRI